MPYPSTLRRLARRPLLAVLCAVCLGSIAAQEAAAPPVGPTSVVPVSRTDDWAIGRQNEVLGRVRAATGEIPIVFLGDSITQGWEGEGKAAWDRDIAPLGALNLGVGGDRTEHVLYRLAAAPLTPLAPRAIVLMIGTNNLGSGTSDAPATLAGVRAVVDELLRQCPKATVVLFAIFPRGETMNPMRGDLCQVNQALERLAAHRWKGRVTFADIGPELIADDGSIAATIMPDHLHLSPEGYAIWSAAVTPKLKALLPAPGGGPDR
jgi:beta-glucosidase